MSHNSHVLGVPASIMGSEFTRTTWLRPFGVDRNICHFLWYSGVAGDGLRSVGEDGELPIQERVLYPAPRHLRAGALRGSGLYNACIVGRVVPYRSSTTRPSLCAPSALRGTSGDTMTTPGGACTGGRLQPSPRARHTGFYHRVGAF